MAAAAAAAAASVKRTKGLVEVAEDRAIAA